MCLSVVGKIEKIESGMAYMDIGGVKKWICIELIEAPQIGDELLIHAGCGISKLTKEEAEEIKEALQDLKKGNEFYYGRNH